MTTLLAKRNFWFSLLMLSCVLAIGSCSKKDTEPQPEYEAQTYPKGIPQGNPVELTIGPTGGVIQSPGKEIVVTIPAGALQQPTLIRIQPISNTLPGSDGLAYRLEPENIHFEKPVTITMQYNNDLIQGDGANIEMAYQNSEGTWKKTPTQVDPVQHTLTVQSNHFSDWDIYQALFIVPEKNSLKPGEKTTLALKWVTSDPNYSSGSDAPIGKVNDYKLQEGDKLEWEITAGRGTVKSSGSNTALFTAPNPLSGANPVGIIARLRRQDPGAPGLLIMLSRIAIIDPRFTVNYNNTLYIMDAPIAQISGGKLLITGRVANSLRESVSLIVNTDAPGTYSYTAQPGSGNNLSVMLGGTNPGVDGYGSAYFDCVTYHASTGKIIITKNDREARYIEGSFTGPVYNSTTCSQPKSRDISGTFSLTYL